MSRCPSRRGALDLSGFLISGAAAGRVLPTAGSLSCLLLFLSLAFLFFFGCNWLLLSIFYISSLLFKSFRTCEAACGGPQCSRLWVHVNLCSSASEGKILGCGLDSSVFCHQSTCLSLLPCGFSTSTFVKGSRRRLPIKLRAVLRPDSLSTCAGTKFTLVIQSPFRLVSYLLRARFCES